MNYRSILIVCLATLGLAVAGWGQADGKNADNPADPSLPTGIGQAVTSSGGEAWVVGAMRRLTDSAGYRSPSWSPDGRHIAYVSQRGSYGKAEIYVMDSDGSNSRRLTDHPEQVESPSWSPDGQHIAFVSQRGTSDIYVMDSDGSNPRRLTDHSADDRFPSWSPDGQYIAFESERDDRVGIYVMDSDGSNPHRLTDHSADYRFPSWSPDGRHIAYVSGSAGNYAIYVMDIASYTGGSRRLWPRPRGDGSNRCFLINHASCVGAVRSASRPYVPFCTNPRR